MNDSNFHNPNNEEILNELVRAIALGEDEFALLLVRCNYRDLQGQLQQALEARIAVETITLDCRTRRLYDEIIGQLDGKKPIALSVLGLADLEQLENALVEANNERELFRQNVSCPLLLWVEDSVLTLIRQRMPDFKSWSSTTFRFNLTDEELKQQLREYCDRRWQVCLQKPEFVPETDIFELRECYERNLAIEELKRRGKECDRDILACEVFDRACIAFERKDVTEALQHYDSCLDILIRNPPDFFDKRGAQSREVKQGIVHFYRSLCYSSREEWGEAKTAQEKCLQYFDNADRPDLKMQFVGNLGDILIGAKKWEELEKCAREWAEIHIKDPMNLARDRSFLAEVERSRENWPQMQEFAESAISLFPNRPAPLKYWRQKIEAIARQKKRKKAISLLEELQKERQPEENHREYVAFLGLLRRLLYDEKRYQEAFKIKQLRRSLRYRFGLRAFFGLSQFESLSQSSELSSEWMFSTSGRQEDINKLTNVRISQDQYKVTVLCGASGVGKSSLIQGGLLPALKDRAYKDLRALPIPMRSYEHWVQGLKDALEIAPGKNVRSDESPEKVVDSLNDLKGRLKNNADQKLLTVLIFDQFEEFFFVCKSPKQRREFYAFLRDCLKGTEIPFVKVIFSLREDYLHELLEFESFVTDLDLDVDFLGKAQRQRIENFTPEVAKSVIEELSRRTIRHLDRDLVERMVEDLTDEFGRIRPVELQIVGAQLEAEEIFTLANYNQLGDNPKSILVEKWIADVIEDCGQENIDVAWQILTFFTDEKGLRLRLTIEELEDNLAEYKKLSKGKKIALEKDILWFFLESGLVVKWSESSDRYQLVHDYFVEPIRLRYNRESRQQLERLVREQQNWQNTQKWLLRAAIPVIIIFASLTFVAWQNAKQKQKLAEESERSEQLAIARQLDLQLGNNQNRNHYFDLTSSLLAVESFNRFLAANQPIEKAEFTLQQVLSELPQFILQEGVATFSQFSKDSKYLAIKSNKKTEIFDVESEKRIAKIKRDLSPSGNSFSNNGQYVFTQDLDRETKLIDIFENKVIAKIKFDSSVDKYIFSQNDQYLATKTLGGTVKIIELGTGEVANLIEHDEPIKDIFFSENDQYLATNSLDGTTKIVNLKTGKIIRTIEHKNSLKRSVFSPDNKYFALYSQELGTQLLELSTGEEVFSKKTNVNANEETPFFLFFDENSIVNSNNNETSRSTIVTNNLIQRCSSRCIHSVPF